MAQVGPPGAHALQQLLDNHDFARVCSVCEQHELEAGGIQRAGDWPYALHMLGYLIQDDLCVPHPFSTSWDSARFLWKRIPAPVKESNVEVQAVWRVLQALWNQDYKGLHTALQQHSWSAMCASAAAYLNDTVRQRTLALLGRAYSTLRLTDAAVFLGLSEAETSGVAQQMGWQLDAATGMLTVVNTVQNTHTSTPNQLQRLTEYVVHLEG